MKKPSTPRVGKPGAAANELDVAEVTGGALGQWVGVSRQRVDQLTADGILKRAPSGKFRLKLNVLAYIHWRHDDARKEQQTVALTRVQAARAREIERRMAREDHRLIETDEAIAILDEITSLTINELTGLPARVTRDLELRNRINQEIDEIRRSVAARLSARARALRASGEAVDAPAEDD